MKKFRFNLDPLLVMRDWEEQRARQVLAESNAQAHRLSECLESMRADVERIYEEWSQQLGGSFTAAERAGLGSQVAEVERRTAETSRELAQARAKCAEAMASLRLASREKKVVEKLREKRLEEYTAELFKQEAAEIENVFNARRSAE